MPTIALTCRKCKNPFKRRTRKGLRTTCPHCGEAQLGPAGQEQHDQQLQQVHDRNARRRERRRTQPPTKPKAEGGPTEAPGTETNVPVHEEARPPEPRERHPNLVW